MTKFYTKRERFEAIKYTGADHEALRILRGVGGGRFCNDTLIVDDRKGCEVPIRAGSWFVWRSDARGDVLDCFVFADDESFREKFAEHRDTAE